MKKSLIALAAVALVGSAFAQDALTLYGRVSVDFHKFSNAENIGQANSVFPSFIGFKGQEAIADDVNAVFKYEQGFDLQNGSGWGKNSRQAYIGVESVNYGSFYLGNKNSLADEHVSEFDALGGAGYLVTGLVDPERVKSSFTYVSPDLSGFTFALQTANKDKDAKRYFAASGLYKSDFGLELGAVVSKNIGNVKDKIVAQFGGAYDFESFKILGDIEYNKNFDKKVSFEFGVTAPITEQLAIGAQVGFGYNKKATRFGVLSTYSLTKRTVLFGGVGFQKNKNKEPALIGQTKKSKKSEVQLTAGIVHNF